jgi:hypothetical protein
VSSQVTQESEQRAQGALDKAKIQLDELESLRNVIRSDDPDKLKGIASDALNKSTLAQIREMELYRRHNTLKAQHKVVDDELQTTRKMLSKAETNLGEQLVRMTAQFESSEIRVGLCMTELEGSVTQVEFERLSSMCVAINTKYCAQLDRERALTMQVRDSSQLSRQVDHLQSKLDTTIADKEIADSQTRNYKEALDNVAADSDKTDIAKMRTDIATLKASEKNATSRMEINEANNSSILAANDALRQKLESRLADVEAEVIEMTSRIRHEQELAEKINTKFAGGLSRDEALKLTTQRDTLAKQNDELSVQVTSYKGVAELSATQLKDLQTYYYSQVDQVKRLNSALEEFAAAGDLEAQLGLALAEQQSLRIRATQAERSTARAEDEAETLADKEQKSNQILDAKRVVIFKLQMLMRSIKTKYEHELQSYRMQVVSRPTEEKVESWNEVIHKVKDEKAVYEQQAFEARVSAEDATAQLAEMREKSDSLGTLIATLKNASTPLDVKISELSQQVDAPSYRLL